MSCLQQQNLFVHPPNTIQVPQRVMNQYTPISAPPPHPPPPLLMGHSHTLAVNLALIGHLHTLTVNLHVALQSGVYALTCHCMSD